MPWLGFRRDDGGGAPRAWPPDQRRPGRGGERFFGRMMGEAAWSRLTEQAKAARRADGPALVADLRSFRSEGPPFDVMALGVPSVFGMGGLASSAAPPSRRGVAGDNVPGCRRLRDRGGAARGAPLAPGPLRLVHPPGGRTRRTEARAASTSAVRRTRRRQAAVVRRGRRGVVRVLEPAGQHLVVLDTLALAPYSRDQRRIGEEHRAHEHDQERDRLERTVGARRAQGVAVEGDTQADADERVDQDQGGLRRGQRPGVECVLREEEAERARTR